MGRTISVRFKDGKVVPSRSKDPKVQAEVKALGEAFLEHPGAVVSGPAPSLDPEARDAARAILELLRGEAKPSKPK